MRLAWLFIATAIAQPVPYIADVTAFGARGDGVTRDEAAIVAAVAAVAAHGGGVLLFPAGTYLTAPFNLTSHCELRLQNATLLAAADRASWPIVAPLPSYGRGRDFPGPRYGAFLQFNNLTSVSIVGEGGPDRNYIDGQGAGWWAGVINKTLTITPGHLIEYQRCADIELSGVTLVDSPFWNTHIWASTRAWVHDVRVRAPGRSLNTDAVDPDSSSHVLIERMDVSNGDDCLAVKSGWDGPGVAFGVPSTNITFRDSLCDSPAGQGNCIAIGSEMSGGVSDVFISNVTCVNSGSLIDVKSTLGRGGYVRNVRLVGATLTGKIAIGLRVSDDYGDNNGPVNRSLIPIMGGIHIADVVAAPSAVLGMAGFFEGLSSAQATGMITDVELRNVQLGPTAAGWHCVNVSGTSAAVSPQPCPEIGG